MHGPMILIIHVRIYEINISLFNAIFLLEFIGYGEKQERGEAKLYIFLCSHQKLNLISTPDN